MRVNLPAGCISTPASDRAEVRSAAKWKASLAIVLIVFSVTSSTIAVSNFDEISARRVGLSAFKTCALRSSSLLMNTSRVVSCQSAASDFFVCAAAVEAKIRRNTNVTSFNFIGILFRGRFGLLATTGQQPVAMIKP